MRKIKRLLLIAVLLATPALATTWIGPFSSEDHCEKTKPYIPPRGTTEGKSCVLWRGEWHMELP